MGTGRKLTNHASTDVIVVDQAKWASLVECLLR